MQPLRRVTQWSCLAVYTGSFASQLYVADSIALYAILTELKVQAEHSCRKSTRRDERQV